MAANKDTTATAATAAAKSSRRPAQTPRGVAVLLWPDLPGLPGLPGALPFDRAAAPHLTCHPLVLDPFPRPLAASQCADCFRATSIVSATKGDEPARLLPRGSLPPVGLASFVTLCRKWPEQRAIASSRRRAQVRCGGEALLESSGRTRPNPTRTGSLEQAWSRPAAEGLTLLGSAQTAPPALLAAVTRM